MRHSQFNSPDCRVRKMSCFHTSSRHKPSTPTTAQPPVPVPIELRHLLFFGLSQNRSPSRSPPSMPMAQRPPTKTQRLALTANATPILLIFTLVRTTDHPAEQQGKMGVSERRNGGGGVVQGREGEQQQGNLFICNP